MSQLYYKIRPIQDVAYTVVSANTLTKIVTTWLTQSAEGTQLVIERFPEKEHEEQTVLDDR